MKTSRRRRAGLSATAGLSCLLFTQTDSNKFFSASRDFLGGLVAIFFAAYSGYKPRFSRRRRLSKIFAADDRLGRRHRGLFVGATTSVFVTDDRRRRRASVSADRRSCFVKTAVYVRTTGTGSALEFSTSGAHGAMELCVLISSSKKNQSSGSVQD